LVYNCLRLLRTRIFLCFGHFSGTITVLFFFIEIRARDSFDIASATKELYFLTIEEKIL